MLRRLFFMLPLLVTAGVWAAEPSSFPAFGVSFAAPAGGTFDLGRSRNVVAHYSFDKSTPYADTEIAVQVDPARGGTLANWKSTYAKQPGATVDPTETTIGGEKAARVILTLPQSTRGGPRTVVSYITIHDDRLYAIVAGSPPGTDASKPLADLLASVKFIPLESMDDHLNDFFDKPIEVFGRIGINGPKWLRTFERAENAWSLGMSNLARPGLPFNVRMQYFAMPTPQTTFADIRRPISESIQKKLKISEPLTWTDHKTVHGLQVTQIVKSMAEVKPGKRIEVSNRFAMFDLGGGNLVELTFTFPSQAGEDTRKYVDLGDRMLATLVPLPRPPAARP